MREIETGADARSREDAGVNIRKISWQRENIDGTFWTGWCPLVGPYRVRHTGKAWQLDLNLVVGEYPDCDTAKKAAQNDYESRVRSALE
jgi:hypothetical protein